MTLLEEFNDRILTLRNVNFDGAAGRLIAILEWLETEPTTNGILTTLTEAVDSKKLFEGANPHQRPRANTREEIAAVGLELIRACREHKRELLDLCVALNIRGPSHSSNFQDMTNAALREYIVPFLEYMEQGLAHAAIKYSPSTVANHRFSELFSEEFSRLLPRTAANLTRLSSEFLRSESEVAWQNVGNSCRQTLIDFAAELREACGTDLPLDIQAGNVKVILKHLSGTLLGEGKFRDSLLSLVDAVWNHTQSITHRSATSKQDALRTFLWTGLVISEFVPPLESYLEG
jgi:hypothetical protein